MHQTTIGNICRFEGKGLHTGRVSKVTVNPAPAFTGIKFIRTDLENRPELLAVAENVTSTSRSTLISSSNGASVGTIEHLMSAFAGLGINNAVVEIDNVEMPILDGSARFYAEAFKEVGVVEYEEETPVIQLSEAIEIKDDKSGAWIRLEPADSPSIEITVDFNSRVLGVQTAVWNPETDYASEIAVCRTFVFFHEIEYLFANNLIKGGDVDNAIVIVEHPASDEQLDRMSALFNMPRLEVTQGGYLNNLHLHFENECGRHKLLDLIGDIYLSGGMPCAKITAFKPGHSLNTRAALAVRESLKK